MPMISVPRHSSQKLWAYTAEPQTRAPKMPISVPIEKPLTRPTRRISCDTGMVVSAAPTT